MIFEKFNHSCIIGLRKAGVARLEGQVNPFPTPTSLRLKRPSNFGTWEFFQGNKASQWNV